MPASARISVNLIQLCLRNTLNTKFNLNLFRPSPYRAVNTLRLGYTNQSVNAVYGNNGCLFSDPYEAYNPSYI